MENARETIIMVDDHITNLTVGKNTLSKKYIIFTAPSGNKLPEMDGYEVINGRLMAIDDVYDVLANDRPYKKPFTHEKNSRGWQYDLKS